MGRQDRSREPSEEATNPLQADVRDRFGVLPNFFRLATDAPEITTNLWGFARFGYLDNPLPSLFKERLFVYLSRFCDIRYCVARHVGFLVGLGRPSGDLHCPPQTIEEVTRLIRRPLPRGEELEPQLAILEADLAPLPDLLVPDTPAEQAIFACATHVFLQTPQAARCLERLRRAFDGAAFQHLLVFLSFVRMAHFWTKVHPELEIEDDLKQLFEIHEALAECVLNDPEASSCETTQVILAELHTLRRERALREEMKRAMETDRHRTEFLAMLAHELRNPLAPIVNALEILRMNDRNETAHPLAVEMLERQVGQMVRLVDDLLDVSRISRGKIELRRSRIELASIVNHAVEAARPLSKGMEHDLTVALPDKPIYVHGDPTRLAQVVGNLLNNACKFTPHGGRIWLSVSQEGDHAVIRVRDSGIGIGADQLPHIFEMFTQLDTSLERSTSGLGIGLSLVRELVELHGGTVEASSAGTDEGSEFVVRLPISVTSSASMAPAEPLEQEIPAMSNRRILVVDDNEDAALSLVALLEIGGNETHVARDGLEAVEAAARLQPDVILLDIGLPKLNGYEVARKIREQPRGKNVVMVALTGWGQDEDRLKSREAGFDGHLVKPVEYGDLTKLLARLSLDAQKQA